MPRLKSSLDSSEPAITSASFAPSTQSSKIFPWTTRSFNASCGLKYGVVHGNIFELWVDGAKLALVIAGSDESSELFKRGMRLWQKTFQILEKRGNPPEKHSGVPMILSGSDIFLRELQFGFLRESPHGKDREAFRLDRITSSLNIAEPRLRPGRRDAQYHHAPRLASQFERGSNDFAIPLRLLDIVIGGEHSH